MRFEPHPRSWKAYREALVIEPLETVEIQRADVLLPALMRLLGPYSAPGIVVRWPEGRAELLVPQAAETFERLRDALDSLRSGAPVGPEAG